jgi:drug/metabolite transporter superfamily protein YnfA
MSLPVTLVLLFIAAALEAGGDALVRNGLHGAAGPSRLLFFLIGAAALFAYGYVVNSPPWQFGDLLGVYVVLFFITAQLISYFFFGTTPSKTLLLGGAFIVIGGVIISIGNSN